MKYFVGKRGTGKTHRLLEEANSSVNAVFINFCEVHMNFYHNISAYNKKIELYDFNTIFIDDLHYLNNLDILPKLKNKKVFFAYDPSNILNPNLFFEFMKHFANHEKVSLLHNYRMPVKIAQYMSYMYKKEIETVSAIQGSIQIYQFRSIKEEISFYHKYVSKGKILFSSKKLCNLFTNEYRPQKAVWQEELKFLSYPSTLRCWFTKTMPENSVFGDFEEFRQHQTSLSEKLIICTLKTEGKNIYIPFACEKVEDMIYSASENLIITCNFETHSLNKLKIMHTA